MITREQWNGFWDKPWVEWGLFALGVVLILVGVLIPRLGGPGCVFFIGRGAALILKTSMWAKRYYVKFKRWQPKAGRWADWALQRRSAKRREALRRAEREGAEALPPESTGN